MSWHWGFTPTLVLAFVWASYSLLTKHLRAFPTTGVGLFGPKPELLSLTWRASLEQAVNLSDDDIFLR